MFHIKEDFTNHLHLISEKIIGSIDDEIVDLSVLSGVFSKVLLLDGLREIYPENKTKYIDLQTMLIRRMFLFLEQVRIHPSYLDGLAGFGWGLASIANSEILKEENLFDDLDTILFDYAIKEIENKNVDFFYGYTGYGNYFIERSKNSVEAKQKLQKIAEIMINQESDDCVIKDVDFSISHGKSALLIFLVKVVDLGIYSVQISKIIQKLSTEILTKIENNRIPDAIESGKPLFSPLRWCHGELGIVTALAQASRILADVNMNQQVRRVAENIAVIGLQHADFLNSATICHGTLGVAHVFRKWNSSFWKSEKIETAALFWYQKSEKLMSSKTGYNYLDDDGVYREKCGILCGIEGIGLALISFLNPEVSEWEDCILLG